MLPRQPRKGHNTMNDQRFRKIERIIDTLGCAVDEAEESAVSLQHAEKSTAKAVWNGAADIRDRLREISDAVDSIYKECEAANAEYGAQEGIVDTEVYAPVLDRLPPAHQVRTDQLLSLCELLDKWRADNGFKIIL